MERECDPEALPKKRAKVEGKRVKVYPKVGLRCCEVHLLDWPGDASVRPRDEHVNALAWHCFTKGPIRVCL